MRMLELTTCYSADIVTWWQVLFQDNPSSGFIRVLPPNVAKPPEPPQSVCQPCPELIIQVELFLVPERVGNPFSLSARIMRSIVLLER